jgi:hypothetical protein
MHILTCKHEGKWAVLRREDPTGPWSIHHAGNVLRTAVDESFRFGFAADLTYSEREAAAVMADVADEPEQLAGVDRLVDLTILAPERRWPTDDRWGCLLKSTGRTELWSPGGGFAGFRQQAPYEAVLKDKVLVDFFGFDDERLDATWRTFVGSQKGVARPHYPRELYIRPQWSARLVAPDAFQAFKPGPVISPEAQARLTAKLGQSKSALKRAKRAEAHTRIRAEAAARAALREQAQ